MRGAPRAAMLMLLAAGATGSGCSVTLASGPPPRAARKAGFTCSSTPTWPVTDLGLSLVGLAAGTYGMTKDSNLAMGLGLGAAAVFGLSAAMGTQRVNACNRALGHPYEPHAPTAQPDMMPEVPFGTAGTARSRGRRDPDLEDTEEQSAAAPPPRSAGPALATPPPDLGQ